MAESERPSVFVHLLPEPDPARGVAGGVAVVVDVLRATTVMVHALAAGCEAVVPCGEIDEAGGSRRPPRGHGPPGGRAAGAADRGVRPGQLARATSRPRSAEARRW